MIKVNDIFISKSKVVDKVMLRVLSYTGEGFEQNCYCILESNGTCWNTYHSAFYMERYYTKMESL